ncbi:MAG: hemin uptake protein HemP [Beijerinckiaceae bacterium]|nr:hemin uptake protein HemP [Beijerinckiaceae bacterium]
MQSSERSRFHESRNLERAPDVSGSRAEIHAEVLMNGGREAIIIHNGERYLLRITAKQKLILTK